MRKIVFAASLLMLLIAACFAFANKHPSTTSQPNSPVVEHVYLGDTSNVEVPTGFMLVQIRPSSEATAKRTWQYLYGTEAGYTFAKAKTLSIIVREGVRPCGCDMEQAHYKWRAAPCDGTNDNLGTGCCDGDCPVG